MNKIEEFKGKYSFLSNFYPVEIEVDGEIYPTVEHAYQAMKTDDLKERENIRNSSSAGKAKAIGRSVTLIPDWDNKRLAVMKMLLFKKFSNPELKNRLLATGDYVLIEGNYWKDTFWGEYQGVGDNNLGKLLMEVRETLLKADITAPKTNPVYQFNPEDVYCLWYFHKDGQMPSYFIRAYKRLADARGALTQRCRHNVKNKENYKIVCYGPNIFQ